jgi:hypothetical protein
MRDEFLTLLHSEGVEIDPELYADVREVVDRFLAVQLAQTAFGELEALKRSQRAEAQVREAIRRLAETNSVEELLESVNSEDTTTEQPEPTATG